MHLAGARLRIDGGLIEACESRQLPVERLDRDHLPRADVHGVGGGRRWCREAGADHISHIHEVPALASISEDARPLPAQHRAREDGHHPGLAAGVLPGTVHIRVAEDPNPQPVDLLEVPKIQLPHTLVHAIGRERPDGR